MPQTVSAAKVQKVVRAIEAAFVPYAEQGPGPTVNWHYSESGHPVIVWEEGPGEWALLFSETQPYEQVSREEQVFIEPVNHVVVGVYPA